MAEKCNNCGWWNSESKREPGNGEPQGRCKAKSPQITAVVMPVINNITREVTPQIIEVTSWPLTVGATDACGSYKAGPGNKPLKIPMSVSEPMTKTPCELSAKVKASTRGDCRELD